MLVLLGERRRIQLHPQLLQEALESFGPPDLDLHAPLGPLKVYTYKATDSVALGPLLLCSQALGDPSAALESTLISAFQNSDSATSNPFEAHFFFVPARPACLSASSADAAEVSALYRRAVESLPHYQITGGRDHIFVFTTSAGPWVFHEWCVSGLAIPASTPVMPVTDECDLGHTSWLLP
jgi:hypothetical protein